MTSQHRRGLIRQGVGLALLGGLCLLWVRSYRVTDQVAWSSSYLVGVNDRTGWAWLYFGTRTEPSRTDPPGLFHRSQEAEQGDLPPVDRFDTRDDEPFESLAWATRFSVLTVPFWKLAAVIALALARRPLERLERRWRERRRAKLQAARERCRRCGYDLRASPQRCPECGLARTVDKPDAPATASW